MLTELRWRKEKELMESVFPEFGSFFQPPRVGFSGRLRGKSSNRIYRVILEANQRTYPQTPPNIHIEPRVGHHWIQNFPSIGFPGSEFVLCVQRHWMPARSSFANTLLAAIRYLDEFDA